MKGLIEDDIVDLTTLSSDALSQLRISPGASLGSTRIKPTDEQLQQIIELFASLKFVTC